MSFIWCKLNLCVFVEIVLKGIKFIVIKVKDLDIVDVVYGSLKEIFDVVFVEVICFVSRRWKKEVYLSMRLIMYF